MGLEPHYACGLGKSPQDVLMSEMHMYLRVEIKGGDIISVVGVFR